MLQLVGTVCLLSALANISADKSPTSQENVDVVKLHKLERRFLEPLENYVSEMEVNLHILEELKYHSNLAITQATESQEKYLGNPVNMFLLIKRLTGSWSKLGDFTLTENPAPGLLEELKRFDQEIPRTGLLLKALDDLEQPQDRSPKFQHDLL